MLNDKAKARGLRLWAGAALIDVHPRGLRFPGMCCRRPLATAQYRVDTLFLIDQHG
jgi:hypothetical protein